MVGPTWSVLAHQSRLVRQQCRAERSTKTEVQDFRQTAIYYEDGGICRWSHSGRTLNHQGAMMGLVTFVFCYSDSVYCVRSSLVALGLRWWAFCPRYFAKKRDGLHDSLSAASSLGLHADRRACDCRIYLTYMPLPTCPALSSKPAEHGRFPLARRCRRALYSQPAPQTPRGLYAAALWQYQPLLKN